MVINVGINNIIKYIWQFLICDIAIPVRFKIAFKNWRWFWRTVVELNKFTLKYVLSINI